MEVLGFWSTFVIGVCFGLPEHTWEGRVVKTQLLSFLVWRYFLVVMINLVFQECIMGGPRHLEFHKIYCYLFPNQFYYLTRQDQISRKSCFKGESWVPLGWAYDGSFGGGSGDSDHLGAVGVSLDAGIASMISESTWDSRECLGLVCHSLIFPWQVRESATFKRLRTERTYINQGFIN